MNYNKYNPRCNSGTEWSCGDDGAVGEDDVDDDPDEARDDDDDDGDDLPSPGRNFPGSFLPAGELFLSLWFPPPWRRRTISSNRPPMFLGQRGDICERGEPETTQGLQVGPRCGPRVGRGQVPPGASVAPL